VRKKKNGSIVFPNLGEAILPIQEKTKQKYYVMM